MHAVQRLLRGAGGTVVRDGTCNADKSFRRRRGILNVISCGPPFPVRQTFSNTNARRTNRNTSPGAIPTRNRNIEAARADKSAAVALVQIQKAEIQETTRGVG